MWNACASRPAKVQLLTQYKYWYKSENTDAEGAARCATRARAGVVWRQYLYLYLCTSFASTRVQILTQKAVLGVERVREQASSVCARCLVQAAY